MCGGPLPVEGTHPFDDLDQCFTGEELRLLETWLEEHESEWRRVVGP